MGIRFYCPNGHKLNVKEFQAGRRGICPFCGVKIDIPTRSTRQSSRHEAAGEQSSGGSGAGSPHSGGVQTAEPLPGAYQDGGGAAADFGAPSAGVVPSQPAPTSSYAGPPAASRPSVSAPSGPSGGAVYPGPSAPSAPAGASPAAFQPAPTSAPSQPAGGPAPAAYPGAYSAPAAGPTGVAGGPAASAPTGGAAATDDPLAEAGNVVWYVRPPAGGQYGPATPDIMRSWLNEGRVGPEALVWREGWREWQQASEVFPSLRAGGGVSVIVTDRAGGTTAAGQRPGAAKRSPATQIVVITALVLAVLSLLLVFLWVLFAEPAEKEPTPPAQPQPPAVTAPAALLPRMAP